MIEGRRQKAESRSRRGFWRSYLLPSAFCLLTWQAFAQDQYVPVPPLPLGDILFSLPTSHIPTDGTFELKFTHRFNQSLDQGNLSDRVHSLWGLDSNADVALAGKYIVVQQAPAVPFGVALRVGGDWRTEGDLNDRASVFAQLIVSRQF